MKKTMLIFALAMVSVFTQCKKQELNEIDEQIDGIRMVLTVDNGGTRTSFGVNGSISWNTNEKIFVVCNGQCVGYVTNGTEGGNTFTGTLTGIFDSGIYDFHYYYVGNTQTIEAGAETFTMEFSNQDGTLANLGDFHVGYGVQNNMEVILGETITAQASMKSLVSIAYFDLAGMAEVGEKVYFYGNRINNQMTIDFSTNTPSFGKVDDTKANLICAGTVEAGTSSPSYVILLPNHADGTEALTTNFIFVSKRTTGTCYNVFNYGIVGGRFYCQDGNTDTPIPLSVSSYDPGSLRGVFSIYYSKTAHFSQGNLQYQASTNTWRFADNQKDYVGDATNGTVYIDGVKCNNKLISSNYSGWIDLFGWGTSGYAHGANSYQPWSTSTDYQNYFAYGQQYCSLYSETGQADWGYNAIANGGNSENNGWYTMTSPYYWDYVFNNRSNAASKYGFGNVNGVNGIILLPDSWMLPCGLSFISGVSEWANNYTDVQWAQMEAQGAVFFPAAGYRQGTTVIASGNTGYYWSGAHGTGSGDAYGVIFSRNYIYTNNGGIRYYGQNVCLVR